MKPTTPHKKLQRLSTQHGFRALVLILLIVASLAQSGCDDSAKNMLGSAQLLLPEVPDDAACLRITITIGRSNLSLFAAAGSSTTVDVTKLPPGKATIVVEAFSEECSVVDGSTTASWATPATVVTIQQRSNGQKQEFTVGAFRATDSGQDGGAEADDASASSTAPDGPDSTASDTFDGGEILDATLPDETPDLDATDTRDAGNSPQEDANAWHDAGPDSAMYGPCLSDLHCRPEHFCSPTVAWCVPRCTSDGQGYCSAEVPESPASFAATGGQLFWSSESGPDIWTERIGSAPVRLLRSDGAEVVRVYAAVNGFLYYFTQQRNNANQMIPTLWRVPLSNASSPEKLSVQFQDFWTNSTHAVWSDLNSSGVSTLWHIAHEAGAAKEQLASISGAVWVASNAAYAVYFVMRTDQDPSPHLTIVTLPDGRFVRRIEVDAFRTTEAAADADSLYYADFNGIKTVPFVGENVPTTLYEGVMAGSQSSFVLSGAWLYWAGRTNTYEAYRTHIRAEVPTAKIPYETTASRIAIGIYQNQVLRWHSIAKHIALQPFPAIPCSGDDACPLDMSCGANGYCLGDNADTCAAASNDKPLEVCSNGGVTSTLSCSDDGSQLCQLTCVPGAVTRECYERTCTPCPTLQCGGTPARCIPAVIVSDAGPPSPSVVGSCPPPPAYGPCISDSDCIAEDTCDTLAGLCRARCSLQNATPYCPEKTVTIQYSCSKTIPAELCRAFYTTASDGATVCVSQRCDPCPTDQWCGAKFEGVCGIPPNLLP